MALESTLHFASVDIGSYHFYMCCLGTELLGRHLLTIIFKSNHINILLCFPLIEIKVRQILWLKKNGIMKWKRTIILVQVITQLERNRRIIAYCPEFLWRVFLWKGKCWETHSLVIIQLYIINYYRKSIWMSIEMRGKWSSIATVPDV